MLVGRGVSMSGLVDLPLIEQQTLSSSDIQSYDRFGLATSVYGDTCAIAAPYEDGAGSDRGAVYIFTRSGSVWTQQQKLTASDIANGDRFGISISLYSNTIVVGADMEDGSGTSRGAAYVFTRSGSVWTQQQKLTASDTADGDFFGVSVCLYADTCIVGAHLEDGSGTNRGAAYVFTRSGSVWTQQQKLTASDTADDDRFGVSVGLYADTAIVGAYFEDGSGTNRGAAYVFTRSGSVWTQQQKLTASDAADNDNFGRSVSVYMDTSVVGSPGNDSAGSNAGCVYVFTRSGSVWSEQQKLTGSATGGWALSDEGSLMVHGNYIVAGSGNGGLVGAVLVFKYEGGSWIQLQRIDSADGENNDDFGHAVSMQGNTIVVGAPFKPIATYPGKGYVYILNT